MLFAILSCVLKMFVINVCNSTVYSACICRLSMSALCSGFAWFFFGSQQSVFRSHFSVFKRKRKWAAHPRVRRFCLKFFPVLIETVFAHIFPVSNEHENDRRTGILSVTDRKGRGLKRMSKFDISNSSDSAIMTSEVLKTDNHEQRRWVRLSGFSWTDKCRDP